MYHDLCPVRLRGMYRVNAASLMFEVTGAWTLICNHKVYTVVWVSLVCSFHQHMECFIPLSTLTYLQFVDKRIIPDLPRQHIVNTKFIALLSG